MPEKKMTIEDLAEVIQRTMASKEDLTQVNKKLEKLEKLELGVEDLTSKLHDVVDEMGSMRQDIRYIKDTMNILVRNDTAQDTAIEDLDTRVETLERKAMMPA